MGGTLQKICKWWRDRTDPAAKYRYDALCRSLDRRRFSTPRGVLKDAYAASVQLSHRPRTQVLEGRPSRSRGHGCPAAAIPLRVSRAPPAGISTVHIPYGRPGTEFGWVWTRNG
jgi:hypothetical protein